MFPAHWILGQEIHSHCTWMILPLGELLYHYITLSDEAIKLGNTHFSTVLILFAIRNIPNTNCSMQPREDSNSEYSSCRTKSSKQLQLLIALYQYQRKSRSNPIEKFNRWDKDFGSLRIRTTHLFNSLGGFLRTLRTSTEPTDTITAELLCDGSPCSQQDDPSRDIPSTICLHCK